MDPRLTPEQNAIVAKWEVEREARGKIIDQIGIAEKKGDWEAIRSLMDQIIEMTPDRCEHDRSIMGTCAGCDEIERILHPELFQDEEDE